MSSKVWSTREPLQEQEYCNELNDNFDINHSQRQSDLIACVMSSQKEVIITMHTVTNIHQGSHEFQTS